MRKIRTAFAVILLAVMVLGMTACASNTGSTSSDSNTAEIADTVVYGSIYTVDEENPDAEAMAIKDGKIVYVGDSEGVQDYIGSNTKVDDYSDSFIMPGFIDGHIHDYVDGENNQGFDLTKCSNVTDYLVTISEYIAEHPDETMYKGFGWTDNNFADKPTAAMLDAICPDKPIYIKSEDCHSCWVNTAMMEKCGITSETEAPIGGVIDKDKDGNPTGAFRDTAMDDLIKPYVELYSSDEYKEMLLGTQEKLLNYGVTAYDEVIIDPNSAENVCKAYHELEEEGKLKIKINCAILVNNTDDYVDKLEEVGKLRDRYSGDTFRITDVKIFMDGIVESETAYVSKAYVGTDNYGADRWPGTKNTERLNDLTKRINDMGLVAHFHAIGDAAVTKALDAIEYAQENSKNKNIRNCITHFQMISDSDIKRFAKLNVIAVANLGWAASANEDVGFNNIECKNVGTKRNNAMYPFKSMLNAGITLSYATDYPAAPHENPYFNFGVGVTRMFFGIKSTQRNSDECLTAQEAIKAMTYGGAYQLGRENEIGTLSVGKSADFIVLNNNLLTTDANLSAQTTAVHTYIDGIDQLKEDTEE